ncbi:unnamed protein product [Ectocarpus sp. 8 AP-2014]
MHRIGRYCLLTTVIKWDGTCSRFSLRSICVGERLDLHF